MQVVRATLLIAVGISLCDIVQVRAKSASLISRVLLPQYNDVKFTIAHFENGKVAKNTLQFDKEGNLPENSFAVFSRDKQIRIFTHDDLKKQGYKINDLRKYLHLSICRMCVLFFF